MYNRQLDIYDKLKHSQDSIMLEYMPALRAMAYRIRERLPSSIDINDLISIGAEEMIKLARRYDSYINNSFWGYAKTRVYGSMLDYLRELDVVSRTNRKLIKLINKEISKYFNEYEEEPSNEYLANVLGEDVKRIKDAKIAYNIYSLVPIDEQYNTISSNNIIENIQKDELVELVKKILETLSKREQTIIQLHYFEGLSLNEISDILNITSSRISQIHKKVIKKIQNRLGSING